jgi:glycogen operon protein
LFAGDRTRTSPYYPSDRRFLDPMAIDVAAPPLPLDHPALRAALTGEAAGFAALAETKLVDTPAVWAAKRRVLDVAFAAFETLPRDAASVRDFATFVAAGGTALRDFAAFEALVEAQGATNWRAWPATLQRPGDAAIAATPAARQRFACFLQWVADRQLAAAADAGRVAGLSVGFYRDLAVGAAPDGAEAWSSGDALMRGAWVGAPPDPFAPLGQVWGLPPPDPRALARDGYDGFAALLRANMRHAGALRIDHVMGLTRLFLVPEGARGQDGAYLAYPFADLLGVAALESMRARCLIVGEDLGTVPPGIRETLSAVDVLSYQVLRFARSDDGLRPPRRYPVNAAACAATHDLPTLAGWWDGTDITEARALGLIDDNGAMLSERARAAEKLELLALLRAESLPADPDWADAPLETDLLTAIHALMARTPCRLVLVQADDLAGELVGVNLPGTDKERPNWRRRLGIGVESLCAAQPAVLAALRAR